MDTVVIDEQDLQDLEDIESRLDNCIKQCGTYFTLDSIQDNTNTDCLEILKFIKTGKK